MGRIVAYYRVSTARQGDGSLDVDGIALGGLGMDAQKAAIARHADQVGDVVIRTYQEIQSAKVRDRAELMKAIEHARRSDATLVVAKLDRLTRELAMLTAVRDSGVRFRAADQPDASNLTINILASVAEEELRAISARTKAGMAIVKARGKLLGSLRPAGPDKHGAWKPAGSRLTTEAGARGVAASAANRAARAKESYRQIAPAIREMRLRGLSLRAIAEELHRDRQTTSKGTRWGHVKVRRVLDMYPS